MDSSPPDAAVIEGVPVTDYLIVAGLAYVLYRVVTTWMQPSQPKPPKKAEEDVRVDPVAAQDMTLTQLRKYDGVKHSNILLSVDHVVYDVSNGASFYGPGGSYAKFAGRDASRALAKGKLDDELLSEKWDELSDLTDKERESLQSWVDFFQGKQKYTRVGALIRSEDKKSE